MLLLDCTIRDGGYYNHWDFSLEEAEQYFTCMNHLPVDIIEVGYRGIPQPSYEGKYFYCPHDVLQQIRLWAPAKELAIMLNEKDCHFKDLDFLLEPCKGLIDTVRLAIAPTRFLEALDLAKGIKERGFKVGFNIMYMSTLNVDSAMFSHVDQFDGLVDYFSLVDSYGAIYPEQVTKLVKLCKSKTNIKIGFHGHNNLELVFANSLAAVAAGAEIIDSTVMGMGRGAGNLKTELWLTHLATKKGLNVDFNILGELVSTFDKLHQTYNWGTNLPYMVSGANSLPQKEVMDWVTKRFYSINSIIRALHNQTKGEEDNLKLPVFRVDKKQEKALIIGGGPTIVTHLSAIRKLLIQNKEICIVHASSKHAKLFKDLKNKQFYCLVGNEGHRLEAVFNITERMKGKCILPPYPRKMGTYVPSALSSQSFELKEMNFNDIIRDSHTALAIQTAIDLGTDTLYIAGYDGYANQNMNEKEQDLLNENNYLFDKAKAYFNEFASLTPTRYTIEKQLSIYQIIS